jgi:hypothetical protein
VWGPVCVGMFHKVSVCIFVGARACLRLCVCVTGLCSCLCVFVVVVYYCSTYYKTVLYICECQEQSVGL